MLNFLKRLFCMHAFEYERDIFTDDEVKVCRYCDEEK